MRTLEPKGSPKPPADRVLLALHCMAERNMTVTASEAEIAAQARVPEASIVSALEDLEGRKLLQAFRKKKGGTTWLVTLAFDPESPTNSITIPWTDPIVPATRQIVYPDMPPDLPLPFFWANRKVARSLLQIIAGLQSLAVDGWCYATLSDICEASGMRDVNTIRFHITHLESEGVIRIHHGREFGRARRAFEILRFVEVPSEMWPGVAATVEPVTSRDSSLPNSNPGSPKEPAPALRGETGSRSRGKLGQLLFAWADGTA